MNLQLSTFNFQPAPLVHLKQWLYEEAMRLNLRVVTVQGYFYKHRCLPVALLRLNRRVVYVLPGQRLVPLSLSQRRRHPQLAGLRGKEYRRAYMRLVRL